MEVQTKTFNNPISQDEEKRADYLIKAKLRNEKEHEVITKELRQIIYKIDRQRL